jgi:potassium-dependent mechanosensitive channel
LKAGSPLIALAVALVMYGVPAASSAAQQPAPPAAASPEPVPDVVEIAVRQRVLADSAAAAQRAALSLGTMTALEADVRTARARFGELDAFLGAVAGAEHTRIDRITRVRDQALAQMQQLESLRDRAGGRFDALARMRAEWAARDRVWRQWRDALRGEADYALVGQELETALARIDSVQAVINAVLPAVLAIQREIETLIGETDRIGQRTAAIREGRRQALLQRSDPVLLGSAFLQQLRALRPADWAVTEAFAGDAYIAFLRQNAGLLVVHLLLIIAVATAARRLRRSTLPEGGWSGTLLHPGAVGIFAVSVLLSPRYAFAPPLWDAAMWVLIAGSGALLATSLLVWPALRRLVYFFAAVYPAIVVAEALLLPAPLFRLGLSAAALAGAVLFAVPGFRRAPAPTATPTARWIVRLAVAGWLVVFSAETLGFHALALWIVNATVTTALTLFLIAFLIVSARGAVLTLLRIEARGRLSFLRTAGAAFAERLLVLLQAFLVIGATLRVLDIWEIAGPPAQTWSRIVASGVVLAGIEITIGRVLLAIIILYVATAASWLVRSFVDAEVTSKGRIDPAVGNSISTLFRYALLTIALFIALGALGIELQNFAIVAGALGVGIGFGLQNIVNNFVSGLILLFERPIRVGDTVVIDNDWGTIQKIGLRSTTVQTFDRSELIVPNADLVSEKVTNWTLSDPMVRIALPVGVAYGSDVQQVLGILEEAALAHPEVLTEPPPQALFIEFGDSALEFELRVWVRELRYRLAVRSAVLAKIDRRLRDAGIEIPFPQRDLHVRSVDPGVVESLLRDGRRTPRGPADGGAVRGEGEAEERA